ncbi:Abi family protein [Mariprofundus ferrooxydans]|uniref:Abi family protein n=1 Tax=Mariprofundus ferrooxydans TaxID=314344 RepID=UPI000382272D|nr:Abi family protein [Mariprofundus ferrooxydans]
MSYSRPWKSFEEQLAMLKCRGMVVSDEAKAINYLERLGYYRLSGYWYPFREIVFRKQESGKISYQRLDNFVAGTQFQDAVRLYVYDKQLRLLASDALERIEVAIRTGIAHLLGERDTFAYQNPALFNTRFVEVKPGVSASRHQQWLSKFETSLSRSKEEFVKHYRQKHGLPLPIWVAVETWDFGMFSILYSGMQYKDQQAIASKFGISEPVVFASWLRSLNYIRNICAHHSRLWNRNVVDQPKLSKAGDVLELDCFRDKQELIARPFLIFCIMQHLLNRICPNSHWNERFKQLVREFPEIGAGGGVCAGNMGLIEGWEQWALWQ